LSNQSLAQIQGPQYKHFLSSEDSSSPEIDTSATTLTEQETVLQEFPEPILTPARKIPQGRICGKTQHLQLGNRLQKTDMNPDSIAFRTPKKNSQNENQPHSDPPRDNATGMVSLCSDKVNQVDKNHQVVSKKKETMQQTYIYTTFEL
jgi:hypothetical protein